MAIVIKLLKEDLAEIKEAKSNKSGISGKENEEKHFACEYCE